MNRGDSPKRDPLVSDILGSAIVRGEVSFGWIRTSAAVLAGLLVHFVFGPSWLSPERLPLLGVILGASAIASGAMLYRFKHYPLTTRALLGSLLIDRLAIFSIFFCLVLWPADTYPGIARIPELGFAFVVTVAAGLRLTPRVVGVAVILDAVFMTALLWMDSNLNHTLIATTAANVVMVLLIFAASGGLALSIAARGASLVSRGAQEAQTAEQVRQRLGAYVSTELLDIVLAEGNDKLGGRRQTVVILFSDIRGFTQYSESREPEALVQELNHYFEAMLGPIQEFGGVVDKFMGDAIMAVWGIPESRPDDASRAIAAAKAMGEALTAHNQERATRALPPILQGIGMHTGEVVAGNIGTRVRRQFTVIGDAVNIASRLEALTKEHNVPVLLSRNVIEAAGASADSVKHRGTVAVRGRTEPVAVYSLR